jgi:hypothetical protein
VIAFEIAFIVILGVVIVVGIAAGGRPLAEAYAERMKYKYKSLDSEAEFVLRGRVAALEQELIALKQELVNLRNTTDFAIEIMEKSGIDIKKVEKKD